MVPCGVTETSASYYEVGNNNAGAIQTTRSCSHADKCKATPHYSPARDEVLSPFSEEDQTSLVRL